jgi:hypothetical protein
MATFSQPSPLPQPIPTPTPPPSPQKAAEKTPAEGEGAPPPLEIKPQPSFFQQPWVQTALPFGTSLVLHLSIILVVVVFFKVAPSVIKAV